MPCEHRTFQTFYSAHPDENPATNQYAGADVPPAWCMTPFNHEHVANSTHRPNNYSPTYHSAGGRIPPFRPITPFHREPVAPATPYRPAPPPSVFAARRMQAPPRLEVPVAHNTSASRLSVASKQNTLPRPTTLPCQNSLTTSQNQFSRQNLLPTQARSTYMGNAPLRQPPGITTPAHKYPPALFEALRNTKLVNGTYYGKCPGCSHEETLGAQQKELVPPEARCVEHSEYHWPVCEVAVPRNLEQRKKEYEKILEMKREAEETRKKEEERRALTAEWGRYYTC